MRMNDGGGEWHMENYFPMSKVADFQQAQE